MNVKPKKSLGQNFLNSMPALGKIVAAGDIAPQDIVLEIGPGKGALTKSLLKAGARVVAVEKDERLVSLLQDQFETEIKNGSLFLITGDILMTSLDDVGLEAGKYKLIANIPYYITGEIIRRFLSDSVQPSRIVLLVQKEVAKRIVAEDQKESLLSLSVKAYGTPEYIGTVKRGSFFPAPKVDSAILLIKDISKNFFQPSSETTSEKRNLDEEHFFKVLHAGFAHKRKKLKSNLISNLSAIGGKDRVKEKVDYLFFNLNLDENVRAEDVSLDTWREIAEKL